MTVMKGYFGAKIDDLVMQGAGSVSGLKSTTKHKIVHDNALNSKPRVVVGAESHENVIIKVTVFGLTSDQAKALTEKRNSHKVNDEDDGSTSIVTFSFYSDSEHQEDQGQYKLDGAKIVGLSVEDTDRENESDPLMMEIEFAVASGGWAA